MHERDKERGERETMSKGTSYAFVWNGGKPSQSKGLSS